MRRASALVAALALATAACMPVFAANPEHTQKPKPHQSAAPSVAPPVAPSPAPTERARGRQSAPSTSGPTPVAAPPTADAVPTQTTSGDVVGTFTLTLRAFEDPDGAGPAERVALRDLTFYVNAFGPGEEDYWGEEVRTGADGTVTVEVPAWPAESGAFIFTDYDADLPTTFESCVDAATGRAVGDVYGDEAYLPTKAGMAVRCDAVRQPAPAWIQLGSIITADGRFSYEAPLEDAWVFTVASAGAAPASVTAAVEPGESVAVALLWPVGDSAIASVDEVADPDFPFTEARCNIATDAVDEDGDPVMAEVTFDSLPFDLDVALGGFSFCVLVHRPLDPNWTPHPGDTGEEGNEPDSEATRRADMTPPETAAIVAPRPSRPGEGWAVVLAVLGTVVGTAALATRPRSRSR